MLYLEDCTLHNYNPDGSHTPTAFDESEDIIVNGCELHTDTEIMMNHEGQTTQFKSKIFSITNYEQAWFSCAVRFCDVGGCVDYKDTCASSSGRNTLSAVFHGENAVAS